MFAKKITPPLLQGLLTASLALAATVTTSSAFAATAADPVILTFSSVGDSRQDNVKPDSTVKNLTSTDIPTVSCPTTYYTNTSNTGVVPNPGLSGQDCKWQQNATAWSKIMRNIQAQKANILFFNGDMIRGYGKPSAPVQRTANGTGETPLTFASDAWNTQVITSDVVQIYQQYGFWRGMVANLMETGTYVVPVPGNHETQCKRCGGAIVQNENAWRDNMGDLILDQARLNTLLSPTGLSLNNATWNPSNAPGAADSLTTPQSQLSYSFDVGTSHFVVVNTDPVGNDGHGPTNWLDADLTYAVANVDANGNPKTAATHLFVFGHKPAFYYQYAGSSISASNSLFDQDNAKGAAFWNVISKHNATYFAGHEHIYNVSQPETVTITNPNNTTSLSYAMSGGTAYQVIVGAGGSPFDEATHGVGIPTDRMYAWATVSIHQSGAVVLNTYGFGDALTGSVEKLGTFTLPNAQ